MFVLMAISRRDFFGRWLPSRALTVRERQDRIAGLEAQLRDELLPYEFTLDPVQTDQLFENIRLRLNALSDTELSAGNVGAVKEAIAAFLIQPWREAHDLAERIRRAGAGWVREFLETEAAPEDLQRIRHRFNMPDSEALEDEIRGRIQAWLDALPDSRVVQYDSVSVRELVFSEIRSWC
jgi:hypothetical protein